MKIFKYKSLLFVISLIFFEFIVFMFEPYLKHNINNLTIYSVCISCIIFLFINKKKMDNKNLIYLFMIIGILIRTMYVVKISYFQNQHDLGSIDGNGHLAYIYNLFKYGKLPSTMDWQFYHPPLFHIFGAFMLKINSILGFSLERCLESIQYISLFASSLIIFITYKITSYINVKDKYKLLINLIMIFHPTFIILSGSINNDVFCVLFQFLIILYLIKWYNCDSYKNTIFLALFTGLCVMSKYNGAIMSVPILFTFIIKFVEKIRKNSKINFSFIKKMILFGAISLTIGLWYFIRCKILFGNFPKIPLSGDVQYNGNVSLYKRFFSISISELSEIFVFPTRDNNIISYIIKSSIFGEGLSEYINIINIILLIFNIFLVFMTIIFLLKKTIRLIKEIIFKKYKFEYVKCLLTICWIVSIISYFIFLIKYPYGCSMDFRYIVITLYSGCFFLISEIQVNKTRIINKIIEISILIFCILSASMFVRI